MRIELFSNRGNDNYNNEHLITNTANRNSLTKPINIDQQLSLNSFNQFTT